MATEKLKISHKAQNKTCTKLQIKNHKKESLTQTDQTTNMTQKSRTLVFKFITPLTSSVKKF